MLWLDPSTNILKVWRAGAGGDISDWDVVADFTGAAALIADLQSQTIQNESFTALIGCATALTDLAGDVKQALIRNLAASMAFDDNGLTITSLSKEFAARLGTQQLEFLKGIGVDAVAIAVFGLLKTVTAPYLQVGEPSQAPRVRVGNALMEYQVSSGNLTFRKV